MKKQTVYTESLNAALNETFFKRAKLKLNTKNKY